MTTTTCHAHTMKIKRKLTPIQSLSTQLIPIGAPARMFPHAVGPEASPSQVN